MQGLYVINIKQCQDNMYTLVRLPLEQKTLYTNTKCNYDKLSNNICRAKSNVIDYVLSNDFKYYVTLTLNDSIDRFDLDSHRVRISQLIRDLRKKFYTNFHYILIPELHKNGAIHFHGFFSEDFIQDFYYNEYNHLSWKSYDNFGFSCIEEIKDKTSCCLYITKYITKDLCKSLKGKHLYFCSQGLKKSKKILSFVAPSLLPINYDFINEYCAKKILDKNSLRNFLDLCLEYDKIISYI